MTIGEKTEYAAADENLGILYGQAEWEPRKEFDVPKEIFDFQLKFAREIAERTGEDVVETAKKYTGFLHFFNLKDLKDASKGYVDGLTAENIAESAYNNYLKLRKREPFPYRNEETGFGCFSYGYNPASETVTMHFKNAELDPKSGPLSADKIGQRKRELTDLLMHVKEHHPGAEKVKGGSWLYNLESYRRLFPDSYISTREPKSDENLWHSTAVWGQFMNSNYQLKQDLADSFLAKAKEVPINDLLSALPFRPLKVQGSIQDFYELYKII
jgi:hypothetical protein